MREYQVALLIISVWTKRQMISRIISSLFNYLKKSNRKCCNFPLEIISLLGDGPFLSYIFMAAATLPSYYWRPHSFTISIDLWLSKGQSAKVVDPSPPALREIALEIELCQEQPCVKWSAVNPVCWVHTQDLMPNEMSILLSSWCLQEMGQSVATAL